MIKVRKYYERPSRPHPTSTKKKSLQEEKNSQIISSLNKIPQKFKFKPPPVTNNEAAVSFKLTTAAILREDALVRKKKQEEEENVNDVMISLRDPSEIKVKLEEEKTKGKGKGETGRMRVTQHTTQ